MYSTAVLGSTLVPLIVSPAVSALGLRSAGTVLCGEINCQVYEFCSSEVDHQCRRCSVICDSKSRNYDENTCDQFCQDYIHDFVRHYIKKGELLELEAQVDQLKSLVGISLLLGIILGILALLAVVFVWTRYRKLLKGNSVGDDFYTKKMNLIKYISRNNNTGPSAAIITPNSTLPQVITVNSSEPSHLNSHNLNSTHNGLSTLSPSHNGLSSSHNAMNSSLQSHNSHCVRPELSVAIPPETCRQITGRCSTSPPMTGRHSISPPSTSSTQLCGQLPRYPSEDATLEHAAYDNLAMTPTPPRTAGIVNERY